MKEKTGVVSGASAKEAIELLNGDAEALLAARAAGSVDLVVMTAPAASRGAGTDGGLHPDRYVQWFLPRSAQFFRVLAARGSFVLNIKESEVDGERHTYVLELIIALRKQGWLWTEEYLWHRPEGVPLCGAQRLPDAWERCLHFTKQKAFKMNQDAVRVPMGDWAKSRLKSLGKADMVRTNSAVGNAFGKRVSAWVGREYAYPTNVIRCPESEATPPSGRGITQGVAGWFVELFSDRGDVVLDPYVTCAATTDAALALGRRVLGIRPVGTQLVRKQ